VNSPPGVLLGQTAIYTLYKTVNVLIIVRQSYHFFVGGTSEDEENKHPVGKVFEIEEILKHSTEVIPESRRLYFLLKEVYCGLYLP
jgi:hypothetical protein